MNFAQIFCCKFGPFGDILASAGFDRQIFIWNVFGECENIACLPGKSMIKLNKNVNSVILEMN